MPILIAASPNQRLITDLLGVATKHKSPIPEFVLAMADTLAMIAAKLDYDEGKFAVPLDERLDAFVERVRVQHQNQLNARARQRGAH